MSHMFWNYVATIFFKNHAATRTPILSLTYSTNHMNRSQCDETVKPSTTGGPNPGFHQFLDSDFLRTSAGSFEIYGIWLQCSDLMPENEHDFGNARST